MDDSLLTKKGIKRASADFGLIAITYNLKRLLNMLGVEELIRLLKQTLQPFLRHILWLIFSIKKEHKPILKQFTEMKLYLIDEQSLLKITYYQKL